MTQSYDGRLELTWTNKPLRLLAQEDGSYEWVNPADYRVAEVRLLHEVSTVGQHPNTGPADNLLIRGDSLNALTSLVRLPTYAREYLGKVKLAYIDPPFNTQQSFLHYDDALEHSVWLTMIRDRLLQIRDLLAPNGSVWVHLDDSEMAHCSRVDGRSLRYEPVCGYRRLGESLLAIERCRASRFPTTTCWCTRLTRTMEPHTQSATAD